MIKHITCPLGYQLPSQSKTNLLTLNRSSRGAAAPSNPQSTGSFQSLNPEWAGTLFSSPRLPSPLSVKPAVSVALALLFLSCHLLFCGGTVRLELLFLSGSILFLLLFMDYMKTRPYNGHQNEDNDFYPFPQYVNELFVKHSSTYHVPPSSHCDHCCCILCRVFTRVSAEAHCICVLLPCLSLITL